MLKLPYTIRNFYALITEDYLYLDRIDRIAIMENLGKELLFLRPCRFGKSRSCPNRVLVRNPSHLVPNQTKFSQNSPSTSKMALFPANPRPQIGPLECFSPARQPKPTPGRSQTRLKQPHPESRVAPET